MFLTKEVLSHPLVVGSVAGALVLAAGSAYYYISGSKAPAPATFNDANALSAITASGVVVPSQNPDLSFQSSGRVAQVSASVGQKVSRGTLLASLDTAALSASRAQAAANLRAAQAKLAELQAGPRAVDVSAKETAVSQAKQSLANLYTAVPNDLSAAYSGSLGAVHADTDTLFNDPNGLNPSLSFQTNMNQVAIDVGSDRGSINAALALWGARISGLGSDPSALEAELALSMQNLLHLRAYGTSLTQALAGAITSGTFSVSAGNTDVAAFLASVGSSLSTLQDDSQALASAKLAVAAAEDALNQTLAGSTPEDIEAAAAAVDAASAAQSAADAALANARITAPYDGTVAAVRIKVGDAASPALPAISLSPTSALEVEAYLSESDASRVAVGAPAQITLDAYGSGRVFPASVIAADRAPTMQNGIPAYKITLQFAQDDPAIALGMTANITLTP